ncbi:MAG TPA: hypothetical protein VEX15_16515 [Nocardioidaceae bacterium]|nr:hypothetical protein [Nocardioidaceae bacterium]
MRVDFTLRDLPGRVDVNVAPVDDRPAVAAWPAPAGLPACEATISYPGPGYHGVFGWIQLVRSTDNASGGREFELDPLEVLGDVSHPFCFFGIRPTLYDAPSRDPEPDLEWLAHSFVTVLDQARPGQISALLGFSWGFRLSAGRPVITPPESLDAAAWDEHREVFVRNYPNWTFAPGFRA